MLSKNRNLLLFIILIVVVGLYFWSSWQSKNESNYKTVLFEFDTATIDQIQVTPPGGQAGFLVVRSKDGWQIQADGKTYTADGQIVKRNLDILNGIKVKRVASRNPDDHDRFSVTPEKHTRVDLKAGGATKGTLLLGKFDYFQPQNTQPDAYGRQPQGEMVFYAALPNDPTVYVVDGQLGFSVGKDVNSFRNNTITNLDKSKIRSVQVSGAAVGEQNLVFKNGVWALNGQPADSAKVAQYLSKIARQNGSVFDENEPITNYPVDKSIVISGEGFADVFINAHRKDSTTLLLNSSQNPEAFFTDAEAKIFDRFDLKASLFVESEKK